MKKTALVIMAAGIGSRFGGGIKQLEPVGPNGEIIMDYSIHDALEAGFDRIIFVIRHDLEEDFKEVIGNRIEKIAPVTYAFQELSDVPEGFSVPADRKKPWGTGQALLSIRGLVEQMDVNAPVYDICMGGFILANTLSENGGVTRGVCEVGEGEILKRVTETYNIQKTADGMTATDKEGSPVSVQENQHVSMNMWGLTPEFLDVLEEGFKEFFEKEVVKNPLKAEYLIPIFIGELLSEGKMNVKVLKTNDTWYGMTYHEDVAAVKDSFKKMLEKGVYKADLFSDL